MEPTHTEPTPGEDCGSYAGWMRHLRAGEQLDQACADYREWWCEVHRGPRARRSELDLRPCGTTAAARRHYRYGEQLDAACLSAQRRDSQDRYHAAKAAA